MPQPSNILRVCSQKKDPNSLRNLGNTVVCKSLRPVVDFQYCNTLHIFCRLLRHLMH